MNVRSYAEAAAALKRIRNSDLRQGLGNLFAAAQDLVDAGEVDVVVLKARRLVCLYDVLIAHGMPELQRCELLSSRYFDAGPSRRNWSDRNVLVLDDTVVVGTSLHALIEDLRKLQPASVRAKAICVDADQHAPFLTDGVLEMPVLSVPHAAIQDFALDIVATLFQHQVPYLSDFPVTRSMRFDHSLWASVLSDGPWWVADVTADSIAAPRQTAYSLLPREATDDGWVQSEKVRAFAKESEDRAYVDVVFVPLGLLRPVHRMDLLDLVGAISSAVGIDLGGGTWKPEALHRLAQMCASLHTLSRFWSALTSVSGHDGVLSVAQLQDLPARLYFGELWDSVQKAATLILDSGVSLAAFLPSPERGLVADRPSPSRLLEYADVREALWAARELLDRSKLPKAPARGELTKIGVLFSHAILDAVGVVQTQHELPERARILECGSLEQYHAEFGDGERRILNSGLTMAELAEHLLIDPVGATRWDYALVMLGVDVGNDLGVVVPITSYDEKRDIAYRAYRIGEAADLVAQPVAARSAAWVDDHLLSAADDGWPFETVSLPIGADAPRGTLNELRNQVAALLPAPLLHRYDGVVTAISGPKIEVGVRDPVARLEAVSTLTIEDFDADDRDQLRIGSRFTWIAWREVGTGRTVSERRVIKRRTIDAAAFSSRLEALRSQQGFSDRAT